MHEHKGYTTWAEATGTKIWFGEKGVPWDLQADYYNVALYGELAHCMAHDEWVTLWTVWPVTTSDEFTVYYFNGAGYGSGPGTARATAATLEAFPSTGTYRTGVNFPSGMNAFPLGGTTNGFSNVNRGTLGTTYFYGNANVWNYLASRGVKLVRFAVRLERLAPTPGGALNSTDMNAIKTQLDLMADAGLECVISINNFGYYHLDTAGTVTGELIGVSTAYTRAHYNDACDRINREFHAKPAYVGLSVMGEPGGMTQSNWDTTAQGVINAIRAGETANSLSNKLLHVFLAAGGGFGFIDTYPSGWGVTDSANNMRIDIHPYMWLSHGSGGSFNGTPYGTLVKECRDLGWEYPPRNVTRPPVQHTRRTPKGLEINFAKTGLSGCTTYGTITTTKTSTGFRMQGPAGGGAVGLILPGPVITNGAIEAELSVAAGEANVMVRMADFNNRVYLTLKDNGDVALFTVEGGSFNQVPTSSYRTGYLQDIGGWRREKHRLRLDFQGPLLTWYLNGVKIASGSRAVAGGLGTQVRIGATRTGAAADMEVSWVRVERR